MVVFILPLNSAVNPLLYTFTTPKYRNQVLLKGWNKFTSRKRNYQSGAGAVDECTERINDGGCVRGIICGANVIGDGSGTSNQGI